MLDGLEELGEEEDRPEHPEAHQHGDAVHDGEAPPAEQPERQHRVRRSPLDRAEGAEHDDPEGEARQHLDTRPADRPTPDQPEDDPEQSHARRRDAGHVERPLVAVGLREAVPGEWDERDPDRHVDPEDPLPGKPLDDGTADEGSDRDREPAERPPDAEGDVATRHGHPRREKGQGERHDERAAGALEGPRRDEDVDARREGRRGRRSGEQCEPDDEHPAPTETVPDRGPREQQHSEAERERVDRPLQSGEARAEAAPDHRQRRRDDEVVERRHELRHAGDEDCPEHARAARVAGSADPGSNCGTGPHTALLPRWY